MPQAPSTNAGGSQQKMSPAQVNSIARSLVLSKSVRMSQRIFSQSGINPASTPTITIAPRNVGLILGFYLQVSSTITNTGSGSALTATPYGAANMLSQISFTDLENNVRIQTPGWHLALVNSLKARKIYGSSQVAATGEDSPLGYGANFSSQIAASPSVPITTGNALTYTFTYWVPLAYSETDLRGAIYANVINATLQLVLSLNQTPCATSPANPLSYVATGDTGTMTSVSITVDQVYLDQLPVGTNGGVILPTLDLSTIYELKQTAYSQGLSVASDFPMQYANFRDFLSTVLIYYNGTSGSGGYAFGTDINYLALQSANFTNIWKVTPWLAALRTRNHLGVDLPAGSYYFGSRNKPISTIQYGNMQLVLNPITAGSTAAVYLAFEDFALKNAVTQAGSIAGS